MRYLVLASVKNEEIESYLESNLGQGIPGVKVIQGPYILYRTVDEAQSIIVMETEQIFKVAQYCRSLQHVESIKVTPIIEGKEALDEIAKFRAEKERADADYRNKVVTRQRIGATHRLEILPLVDWRTRDDDLETEVGVSYLIKTDEATILFDLGLNMMGSHPSPLLSNMKKLGVALDEIDSMFITHRHSDHVGGEKWVKDNTFSLSGEQISLDGVKVYTPVEMSYPGLDPIHSPDPFTLSEGVASIGTIPSSLFGSGYTLEMGLAVNVAGKGIVLVIGCGHQGLPRILERCKALYDEPLYGIVGGLHYPVMGGPIEFYGYYPHRHQGTGKLPWEPISVDELMANVELLKSFSPELVALSPHDSSEYSIDAFREAFPGRFREIQVGTPITVG